VKVDVNIEIAKSRQVIWQHITDIENSAKMISGIQGIGILHRPQQSLVGLKWQETRIMFGKQATEIMWVTEAVEDEYYCTQAQSHGAVYNTKLALTDAGSDTRLTMSFSGQGQTWLAKIISACMGIFIKGSMKKALYKDLADIKQYLEQGGA